MLRSLAWGISVVFHPLLVPSYMLVLLLLINPYLFGVSKLWDESAKMLMLLVFLYTFFIPAVSIMVMYFLGMVQDVQAREREDRIGPYLCTGMLDLWVYYNFSQQGQLPPAYVSFMLGVVLALFLSFIINIFSKISAHAVGMGGLIGMVIISMIWFSYGSFTVQWLNGLSLEVSMLHLLMIVLVIAGAVGTARLFLKAHQPADVYGGYFIGFVTQFFAFAYVF